MTKAKRRNHQRTKPGSKKPKSKGLVNSQPDLSNLDGSHYDTDSSSQAIYTENISDPTLAATSNNQTQFDTLTGSDIISNLANDNVKNTLDGNNSPDSNEPSIQEPPSAAVSKPLPIHSENTSSSEHSFPANTKTNYDSSSFNRAAYRRASDRLARSSSPSVNLNHSLHNHHQANSPATNLAGSAPNYHNKKPFAHKHSSSLPTYANNNTPSSPGSLLTQPPPSNPKRPAYIRQISGINDGSFPPRSPLVNCTTPLYNGNPKNRGSFSLSQQSPMLVPSSPTPFLLDDDTSSIYTNYGTTGLTQLPRRGKLKPKMKSYWAYYIPALEWIPHYRRKDLLGDICAGLTLASFQIPVSMSYASSLAHVPMVCGLYGLVIGPLVYGLMGTTPYMVVGPEAALSLVVGQSVLPYLDSESISPAHVSGIISGACGAVLLCAGLLRFGYLDSVLSRALLRGFISAVGFVMVIDQLVSELKLGNLLHKTLGAHTTTWDKMVFLVHNVGKTHRLTAIVAFTAMLIIILFRIVKAKVSRVFKQIIFVPEILLVVIVSTILTDWLNLDERGLDVVGKIETGHIGIHLPFTRTRWSVFKDTFSASFVCAVLGFFESTIASKSLAALANASISTNRELVALGVTNIVGSVVNALPSFGGYGRSKINMLSGARTHLASFVLAGTTAFCIAFAMHYFYYLPKCVLSAVISVIGLSLIEEAPRDILFYWKVGGYEDLFTMLLTLVCTVFWSLEVGIAIGVGFSVVRVIRHSTKSRIQILGRIPGTSTFENADGISPEHLEEIDGCLICKIPEPLFFANTGDLRNRLRRLEVYGSMKIHPSFPRIRDEEMTRSVIFDLHGMTKCDASAMQILTEIVSSYAVDRKIPVLFARVPQSKTVRTLFKSSGLDDLVTKPSLERYFGSIDEALRYIDQRGLNYQPQRPGSENRV